MIDSGERRGEAPSEALLVNYDRSTGNKINDNYNCYSNDTNTNNDNTGNKSDSINDSCNLKLSSNTPATVTVTTTTIAKLTVHMSRIAILTVTTAANTTKTLKAFPPQQTTPLLDHLGNFL